MNKVILIGRLARDPDVRRAKSGDRDVVVARYTLAVDRAYKRDGDATADFIGCVTFGKTAEFVEKYLSKGSKIAVEGRIQTGSYTDKDGNKRYTTDVVVERCEFAESKRDSSPRQGGGQAQPNEDGFFDVPDGIEEELPFA